MSENSSVGWVAIAALGLGIFNSAWTFYIGRRDNAKLVTSSTVFNHAITTVKGNSVAKGIIVRAVNMGRRPIIVTKIQFKYDDGTTDTMYTNEMHIKDGVKLEEQESHEHKFSNDFNDGYFLHDPVENKTAINCWYEDTAGKKYYVRGFKENLKKVWEK